MTHDNTPKESDDGVDYEAVEEMEHIFDALEEAMETETTCLLSPSQAAFIHNIIMEWLDTPASPPPSD